MALPLALVDAAPAVWQSFITSNIALCQLIVDELTEKMEAKQTEQAEQDDEDEEGGGGGPGAGRCTRRRSRC